MGSPLTLARERFVHDGTWPARRQDVYRGTGATFHRSALFSNPATSSTPALIEGVVLGDGKARHQAVVAALLKAGASTSLVDRDGKTPLQLAKGRGYAEIVTMLERAGAK